MALDTNLTSWYKCEENAASTTVADAKGSNTGTASTNTSNLSVTGKVNNGFEVTTAETINCGTSSSLFFSSAITVAAWVKTTSNGWVLERKATGAGLYNYLFQISSGKVDFFNDRTAGTRLVTSTSTITDGNWHLIVGRGNSAGMDIYVDNVLEAHVANTNAFVSDALSDPTYLGGVGATWAGAFDEIGIFNASLTDGGISVGQQATGEIAELWNSGNGVTYPFVTTSSFTKTGNARISIEDNSFTKNANSRILIEDNTQVYDGTARILKEQSFTKTGNARILIDDNEFTKNANARLLKEYSFDKTANSRILKEGSFDKTGNAYILRGGTFDLDSNARILIEDLSFDKSANSSILIEDNQFTKNANSRILKEGSFDKSANASLIFRSTIEKTGQARILIEQSFEKSSNARILKEGTFDKTGQALITFMSDFTKTGNASLSITDTFKPTVKVAESIKPQIKSVETFN